MELENREAQAPKREGILGQLEQVRASTAQARQDVKAIASRVRPRRRVLLAAFSLESVPLGLAVDPWPVDVHDLQLLAVIEEGNTPEGVCQ